MTAFLGRSSLPASVVYVVAHIQGRMASSLEPLLVRRIGPPAKCIRRELISRNYFGHAAQHGRPQRALGADSTDPWARSAAADMFALWHNEVRRKSQKRGTSHREELKVGQ